MLHNPTRPRPTAESFLLFVYGTLKSTQSRGHVLAGQEFLGKHDTAPAYVLLSVGTFPCMVHASPGDSPMSVTGEVYRCQTSLLPTLDAIEGAPHLFDLEPIMVPQINDTVYGYIFQDVARGRVGLLPHTEREWFQ